MLTFAAAVFFLIVTPGPGVLSLAGVGSAFGARPGMRYLAGLFLGTNAVALAVISGVAAIVLASPVLRTVLFAASTAYLVYLAFRIATAGGKIAIIPASRAPGIRGGLALQALNPKAYVVNTTLFTGFSFLPGSPAAEIALKLVIVNAIWLVLHVAWLFAGIGLRRLDLPPGIQRGINVAMAASMLLVVALAVFAG
ncbi:LysE family translocator [Jannaschia aquimarina]|uniref:Leucine export protein LeuE n=1 Tax=Jannaschia aquimarina TaxID=935700 RepID=A0A0D1EEA2_9RHOB|nr:LysE family transporter [Jannaschia aquimarina]KIT15231.1 leucine export protein LeuE [Jannaschia aquimarina]SNT32579.1 Threonine/homoserine/homoserine lactone efflux protein [Jannaschia aquimarina]